ncbi:hypothetical protein Tco_1509674 [Tanacetum coccineum]
MFRRCSIMCLGTLVISSGFQAKMSKLRWSRLHSLLRPSFMRVELIITVCFGYSGFIATLIFSSTIGLVAERGILASLNLILWQGELYQKTDHVFTVIEVIRMVRLGMIKRSKCEEKGIVPTEMELVLEYTQQGASHEVSDHLKMEMEMEIPSVKASANSDIIFFFTSAQDGNKLLDDERLSLADDLKKAHDQNQNKSK